VGHVVAIAQVAPRFLDLEGSLERAVAAIGEAAGGGARLVAFAETWLPGYPQWIDVGVGWEEPVAKETFALLQRNSVEIPGPAVDVLAEAARTNGVHVVIGVHERDARFSRGTLYNTLLYLSDEGEVLGAHRKLIPTHSERVVWGQGDGSTLHVFDTPLGRLGGLICWEHWMPLTRFAMHAKAEQIHVAVWPDAPELHQIASRSYAFEGRCYVLCAAGYLSLADVPPDLSVAERLAQVADVDGLLLQGGSGVIGPDGRWIAGPMEGSTIVYAELDLDRIGPEQQALDAVGHYNRPDVFRLLVDESAREPLAYGPFAGPS
jgi:predicted amidohydrolase